MYYFTAILPQPSQPQVLLTTRSELKCHLSKHLRVRSIRLYPLIQSSQRAGLLRTIYCVLQHGGVNGIHPARISDVCLHSRTVKRQSLFQNEAAPGLLIR